MNELYYDHPIQVRYWDTGLRTYVGGIGFQDFIICGCCGKKCEIDEILAEAAEYDNLSPDEAIIEMDWIDIEEIIRGE